MQTARIKTEDIGDRLIEAALELDAAPGGPILQAVDDLLGADPPEEVIEPVLRLVRALAPDEAPLRGSGGLFLQDAAGRVCQECRAGLAPPPGGAIDRR